MRKPMLMGTCVMCPCEIFSWVDKGEAGRQFLANGEYRDVKFILTSPIPAQEGSTIRIGMCSSCCNGVDESKFDEITQNWLEGIRHSVKTSSMSDEDKMAYIGQMSMAKIAQFCDGTKIAQRSCQHCNRLYQDGTNHHSTCEVVQHDLQEVS